MNDYCPMINIGIPSDTRDFSSYRSDDLIMPIKKQIPFVVVIGSEEMQSGNLTLKNMNTGEQEKMNLGNLINYLSL